jgi:hypothetical protein
MVSSQGAWLWDEKGRGAFARKGAGDTLVNWPIKFKYCDESSGHPIFNSTYRRTSISGTRKSTNNLPA